MYYTFILGFTISHAIQDQRMLGAMKQFKMKLQNQVQRYSKAAHNFNAFIINLFFVIH